MNRVKKLRKVPRLRAWCKTCTLLPNTKDAERLAIEHMQLLGRKHETGTVNARLVELQMDTNLYFRESI